MKTEDSETRLAEERALEKYRVLVPYLQGKCTLASIAKVNDINVRTARRWLDSLDKSGFAGLKRDRRSDLGKSKFPAELKGLIEGLFLQSPPMPGSTIHRKIQDVCKQQNWSIPSYSSVHRILTSLEPAIVTLAQDGKKAYTEQFDIVLIREADFANDIWQADHKELDVTILGPDGKPCRPWLTAVIDDFSRAVPGYYIGIEAPSILRTALAFRQAIWKKNDPQWMVCGIPGEFYVDHGSDFTSRHIEQVAADLKVGLSFSLVGEPRGRGKIERFFRSVNQLLCAGLPGYLVPRNGDDRPLLKLEEFQVIFHKWLVSDYLHRVHSETDMTPFSKWNSNSFMPRLPESLGALDLLLLTVKKKRSVRTDGIHFESMRYTEAALSAITGHDVVIRYDPRDLSQIRVYWHEQYFCTATCEKLTGKKQTIKDIATARNRRRKALEREISARSDLVKLYMQAAGNGEIDEGDEPSASSGSKVQRPNTSRLKVYKTDVEAEKVSAGTVS